MTVLPFQGWIEGSAPTPPLRDPRVGHPPAERHRSNHRRRPAGRSQAAPKRRMRRWGRCFRAGDYSVATTGCGNTTSRSIGRGDATRHLFTSRGATAGWQSFYGRGCQATQSPIAYAWGLREGSRVQSNNGYSPSNLCRRAVSRRGSPRGLMTSVFTPSRTTYGETVLLCLLESYSSSVFHITRAIVAIFLASETLARLDLVPAANQRW